MKKSLDRLKGNTALKTMLFALGRFLVLTS